MNHRHWARPKQSGAHGLRRGAWYVIVNSTGSLVVLDVRRKNVLVPRSMVDIAQSKPEKWSVVQWQESQLEARRVSEMNLGLTYGVCPACGDRAPLDPPDAKRMTCEHCGGEFEVDWEHPC